jgi:hypothetical protein
MLPSSVQRVPLHTDEHVNRRIAWEIDRSIEHYAAYPEEIPRRLHELEVEWDVERVLEANASALILVGLALAASVDRRWAALSGGVAAFLFQHALQGWCPPLPVLRGLGFRTMHEIDRERTALRILRGDLGAIEPASREAAAQAFSRGEPL